MQQPIQIESVGMTSSLGVGVDVNCAAIHLNYDGFALTDFKQPNLNKPLIGAAVDCESRGDRRIADMAQQAISEALSDQPIAENSLQPIVCLADSNLPHFNAESAQVVANHLSEHFGSVFKSDWLFLRKGAVGLVTALEESRKFLYEDAAEYVLLIASESLLTKASIEYYGSDGKAPYCRLLTEDNADGFIPGEAAAAVLLSRPKSSKGNRLWCTGIGFGTESAQVGSGEITRAEGLVSAVEQATKEAGFTVGNTDFRVNNCSGEKYFFEEDALMLYRTLRPVKDDHPLWHTADSIGEVGAVAGVAMIALVYWAAQNNKMPGPRALCCLHSDYESRGAFVIEHFNGELNAR